MVFYDNAYNLVSVYTSLRWMIYGKEGNSGVSQRDIDDAPRFGEIIHKAMDNGTLDSIHPTFVRNGAINVISNLTSLEKTANKLFSF